jgi:uncharacterized SAM-binding protein YcdF (DUF218 family)
MKKIFVILILLSSILIGYIIVISLYLPTSDQLQKADAVVAVSGGDTSGRAMHAIALYQEGWAPKLIFSGAAADPMSASNARVMMSIAASRGVPPSAIYIDEAARDTKENAHKTKEIIKNIDSIILVTSDYHQRRVYREFKKVLSPDVKIINSPAKDKHWGRKSWFLSPYGWWISITEPLKLLFSRIAL